MVEVFKTDVQHHDHANMLVDQIHQVFAGYKANFDLDDCDRILRVKNANGSVHPPPVIELLKYHGFSAEVLPDEVPASAHHASPHSFEQFLQ